MTPHILLIAPADSDSIEVVATAAAETRHHVIRAVTSRAAFKMLNDALSNVELIVIDLDPGAHGLALLEALNGVATNPPVIVLTGLEESYMKSVGNRHGAIACLGKPFNAGKLAVMIKRIASQDWRRTAGALHEEERFHYCATRTDVPCCGGCQLSTHESERA
jgi:DNA-binding response OmpR family regulator